MSLDQYQDNYCELIAPTLSDFAFQLNTPSQTYQLDNFRHCDFRCENMFAARFEFIQFQMYQSNNRTYTDSVRHSCFELFSMSEKLYLKLKNSPACTTPT